MQIDLIGIVDDADTLMNLGWRIFYLEGQTKPFVWDSSSQYLASVPQKSITQLLNSDIQQSLALQEALKSQTFEH